MQEDFPWLNTVFKPREYRSDYTNRLVAFAKEEFVRYVNRLLQAGDDAEEGLHHPNEASEEDGKSFLKGVTDSLLSRVDGTSTDPFYKQGTRVWVEYLRTNKENLAYRDNVAFKNGGQVKRRIGSL
jgi:hypothetical protein